MQEALKAIDQAPNAKAVGIDEIPMDLIKRCSGEGKLALARIFKKAFEQEEVPEDWRRGVVVPIPKAGDSRCIENYRGN